MYQYKKKYSFEARCAESKRILVKYPDRIPIIVENSDKSDLPKLDNNKYLVPRDLTVGQFMYVLRERIKLEPEKAIFMFVNNTLPATAMLMSQLYSENKDADFFLYAIIQSESTFGTMDVL